MKRLFGVKQRSIPNGSDTGSRSSNLKNGRDISNSSISSAATKPSGESKENKLVKLMNEAGMKIQELKNVLKQESLLAQTAPDTLKLQAFIRQYSRQVEVVDSIRHWKGGGDPGARRRDAYHRFAEDLQQQRFGHENVSIQANRSKVCYGTGTDVIEQSDEVKKENSLETSLPVTSGIRSKILHFEGRASDIEPSEKQDEDETDATPLSSPAEEKYYAPPKFPSTSSIKSDLECHTKHLQNENSSEELQMQNVWNSKLASDKDTGSDNYSGRINHFESLNQQSGFESVPNAVEQEIIDLEAPLIRRVCNKPMGRSPKVRPRLDDVFPFTEGSLSLSSSTVQPMFTSSPVIVDTSPRVSEYGVSRISSQNLLLSAGGCGGEYEELASCKNRTKSKNESWYEYKERCSQTSLHNAALQNISSSDISPRRSPFMMRDYVNAADRNQSWTSPKTKSVRFSLSPHEPAARTTTSSELSSDDEVGFNVSEFPCRKSTGSRQRYSGHRRKY